MKKYLLEIEPFVALGVAYLACLKQSEDKAVIGFYYFYDKRVEGDELYLLDARRRCVSVLYLKDITLVEEGVIRNA